MRDYDKISLRSEEVQEILGTPPSFLVRWGTLMIILAVSLLILSGFMIEYSDTNTGQIIITTPSPAMEVVAPISSKLEQLLVAEGDSIEENELVAVLGSPANFDHILALDTFIQLTRNASITKLLRQKPKRNLKLGNVQTAYSEYVTIWEDYYYTISSRAEVVRSNQIQVQIDNYKSKIINKRKESEKIQEEVVYAQAIYNKYVELWQEGKIDTPKKNEAAKNVLTEKRKLDVAKADILDYKNKIDELESEISSLEINASEAQNTKYIRLMEAANRLSSNIAAWKNKYLLFSPATGKVTFPDRIVEQTYLQANQNICVVIPDRVDTLTLGRMLLPASGAGKVKIGQKVNIKLDDYPYQEFGMLRGEVASISPRPIEGDKYIVEVKLSKEMITSYGEAVTFRQDMPGIAEIKTAKKKIIERIFESIWSV